MHQLAVAEEIIFPQTELDVATCLIGDNFSEIGDAALVRDREKLYGSRRKQFSSIILVKFASGTRLFGGRHFLLESSGYLVEEQVPPPNVLADKADIQRFAAEPFERVHVDDPCIMVPRYGLMVWGHWVGELLPRILLSERAFPGRFKFVLPDRVFSSSAPRNVWNSIWDTIRLLGIDRTRVITIREDQHYIFKNLYCITPVTDRAGFHPNMLESIRDAYVITGPQSTKRKIALLRTESKARNVTNVNNVIKALRSEFEFVEIGKLPFQEQVNLFSTTSTVVGVLASGLTGLMFSPDNVKVLSLAPKGYANTFFYPIMQSRKATYYDVRGEITSRDPRSEIFSDFDINVEHLIEGLRTLGE